MSQIQYGPLPPPLGGVSVYLYRYQKLHPEDRFVNEATATIREKLRLALAADRETVFHGFSWKFVGLFSLLSPIRRQPYTIVLHGEGALRMYEQGSALRRWLIRRCLCGARRIRVVGPHIAQKLRAILPALAPKCYVENAFLPPPLEDEPRILASYPDDLRAFLRRQHPIIVANAFKLVTWKGCADLYGLDMCVELLNRLHDTYPDAGLVFALADATYRRDYQAEIAQRIEACGLTNRVYFLTDQHELWPLFRRADLMVRPTATDGFALSVQEALSLGCRVVASDAGERPTGTITFRCRDIDDFEAKVRMALADTALFLHKGAIPCRPT